MNMTTRGRTGVAASKRLPARIAAGHWASIRDLEVLDEVIRAKSTTLAASRLGISQPAVSRALAQMEERSGRTLFRREGHKVVPTADAMVIFEETRNIFASLQRLSQLDWTEKKRTPLRLAVPPTLAHCFLDRLAARFVAQTEGAVIAIEIVTTPQVFEMVADRTAEIGVADLPSPNQSLERVVFRRSAFACAMPLRHPLARKSRITPGDLDGQNLVALVKRNPARMTIDRLLLKADAKANVVVETSNALSAIDYVRGGLGVALVNPFPVALNASGVVFRPFEPRLEYETAFFLAAGDVAGALPRRFIEFIRAQQSPSDEWSTAVV